MKMEIKNKIKNKIKIWGIYIITTIFLLGFFIKGMLWVYLGHPKFFWFEPLFLKVFS